MKKGIDVSYANGKLDWKKLRSAGIEFAVIRSSFGSDDPSQVDSQFRNNAQGCCDNGIPFMTYHFAYFIDKQRAREEADFAIRLAKEYPQVKAIALDIEEDTQRFASLMGAYPDWTECAEEFMQRIQQAGYKAVLYTNYSFMTYVYDYDKLKKYPLWLASPGASESTARQYDNLFMWQYSWTGHPDGSSGDTDMDCCYDMDIITGKSSTGASSGTGGQSKPSGNTGQVNPSAPADMTVQVTSADGVNIRSGAGLSYNVLGAVPFGTVLHITRRTSGSGYIWGLTEYSGIKGWIALEFTKTLHDNGSTGASSGTGGQSKPSDNTGQVNSSAPADMTVQVTSADGVNIRSGAGLSYNVLGAVPFGTVLHITRRTSGSGYIWGLTEYSGIKGWIALEFTETI